MLLALALAGPGVARAEPPAADPAPDLPGGVEEIRRVSQAVLDAWRAKDFETLKKLGAAARPDPITVLSALHSSLLTSLLADPPKPNDYGDAAEAFVEATRMNPAAAGVAGMRAEWRRYDRADLEREVRLREAYRDLRRTLDPADCEADLARIRAADADISIARGSTTATKLAIERLRSLQALGRFDEAVDAGRATAVTAARSPWPIGEAVAWRGTAHSAFLVGDLSTSVEAYENWMRILRGLGFRAFAAQLRREKAQLLRTAARHAEALAEARAAHEEAVEAGAHATARAARVTEATVLIGLGRGAEAAQVAEKVALDALEAGDAKTALAAWITVGNAYVAQDRFAEALTAFERAAERAVDDPVIATHLWTNVGIVHRRMRRTEAALADQRRALAAATAAGDRALVALTKGNLGITMAELGMPGFRATLEEALAEKRLVRDRIGAAETLLSLANILTREPATIDEGRALLEQALREVRTLGDPVRIAVAHSAIGAALVRTGDLEGALAARRTAEDILDRVGNRSAHMADIQDGLADLHLVAGRVAEAVAAARRGMELRRALASGLGEEDAAGLVDRARASSDLGVEAAGDLLATDAPAAAAAAFDFLEGGRATILAAGIVNAEALLAAEVPAPALAAEAEGRARVGAARQRLVRASYAREPDPRAIEAARHDLDGAVAVHAEAVARVRRVASSAAGVAFPSPVSLAALREALGEGEAFVGWQVTPNHVFAVVVRRGDARLRALGPAAGLAGAAEAWIRMASTPGADDHALATALYDRLVGPLEQDLEGVRRVFLAPDGPLAFVPFEALLRVRGETRERLVERLEATYVPSATVLLTLLAETRGRAPGRGFVGLGDPDYATVATNGGGPVLPALPASRGEVLAVAKFYEGEPHTVLLGRQATKEALLAALPQRPARLRALHVAAHAFVDPEHPRLSSLVLAGGQVLDVDAIHRLRVPADVAVLSACSTGRGALLRGEGVLGFARGFFYAGVPRVVVSNWVVSDAQSATILRRFHEKMVREGLTAAAALRAAKLAALRSGGEAAHPFAWAPFVLWGLP
ncbi:MAG TPA: CHAT domain-containing protein [Planctomycetota bacterium]|nr:CHAT domain-containing protein [Planctomycetota bacterium]